MKLAICTLTIGESAQKFAKYSHPIFQKYADRIGADFVIFDRPKINYTKTEHINPLKFEKYQVAALLDSYDRVAYFDSDIIITPHAPNIFECVPEDCFGGIYEDMGPLQENRRDIIEEVQEELGDVGWETGYINTGVFVASKIHQKMFFLIHEYGVWDDPVTKYEQTNTNWYLHKAGHKIYPLYRWWNYMGWNRVMDGPDYRSAYVIHYAGGGIFSGMDRVEQMKNDFDFFYRD